MTWQPRTYPSPAVDISQIDDDIHGGRPLLEFLLPGGYGGQWDDKQKWSIHLVLMEQGAQEADGLNGLPQTHLISENTTIEPAEENTDNVVVNQSKLMSELGTTS